MLTSLAYIFLLGLALGWLARRLGLPGLVGMIFAGVLLGPCGLGLLDGSLLSISAELRRLALVIILTRAGLSLELGELKKVGRPAVLLCFVPACFEMGAVILLAPPLLGCSRVEAAVIGAVIAAVSPAVVVPRMLRLIEEGWGRAHAIPQLILAGASVDDVFVIVMFSAFTSIAAGGGVSAWRFVSIPLSIVLGLAAGAAAGALLTAFFRRFHMRDSVKVLLVLSVSFLLLEWEQRSPVPLSGLLAVMALGATVKRQYPVLAERLSGKYNRLWAAAEVLLFALVGAALELPYVRMAGAAAVLLIVLALCVRMLGAAVCVAGTPLTRRERLFCMLAYTPKATVQAAIGGVPLAMGLACGSQVLTVAVLSILLTAPLGAFAIDHTYRRLLTRP